MEKRPLVSVIMPTYNCAKYIAEAIQSVIDQTMPDWEIQIADDASTDNTQDVLKPYLEKYPRIHYTRLDKNNGAAAARAAALARANGKYVAFLDSDDLWYPEKLEKQIAYMQRTGYSFSCTGYEWLDMNGRKKGITLIPPAKTDYKKMVRLSCPIGNLTVMYDQDQLGKQTYPRVGRCEDMALWLRLLKQTPGCGGMTDILAGYRIREGSASRKKLSLAKYIWQIYRDCEGKSVLYSCYGLFCWAFVKGTGIGLCKKYDRTKKERTI